MAMIPTISHLTSCPMPIPNWNDYPDVIDKLRFENKNFEDGDQFNEPKTTQVENGEGNRHERRKQRAHERAKQKKHGQ